MLKRYWRHTLATAALLLIGIALLLWSRSPGQPRVEHRQLADGSPLTLVTPKGQARHQVVIAVPDEQSLSDAQLLALSQDGQARLVQFFLVADADCAAQQARLHAVLEQLGAAPTALAGIGSGANLAWRWLAGQNDDKAHALSVAFDLDADKCATPLPNKAAHGHWLAAWNDNPTDASARFAREQSNAETIISDYDTPLTEVLYAQLRHLLQGDDDSMPVVEVPAAQASETVTLFYSGDGGWRDLDRDVAEQMAKRGYPVVGIDALRYYWQHKSPEQSAQDLAKLMQRYRDQWGAKRFVLTGYSFGADVLPAIYNHLQAKDQQQVDALLLIALARSGSFEIEVEGWLGKAGAEAATGPELAKLPAAKVLCVYGKEEAAESGCTQPGAVGERLELPGGHHFDENYPALAERLLKAVQQRQGAAP
ncbi:virulence factor family protein [Pseudomonas sp. UL073]|uniref:Virulence factor family protein n=1 Tax=Zestomonas insulae TaxID=2809017 RepID=A0ABS2IAG7_9GAMM|nr:virulence factor family protein [Pseudomonas insulae]MBM7059790.1 virulence factor family protein [Pseudomonas insulae]